MKNMYVRKIITILFIALVLAVLALMTGCSSSNRNTEDNTGEPVPTDQAVASWSYDGGETVNPEERSEIVTVTCDALGGIDKISSAVSLKVPSGADSSGKPIKEKMTLTEIRNKEGAEEFSLDGDNLYWQNLGEDIEYEGVGSEDIPVTIKITYKLDDEEITPEKLAGKSGKLTMRIDYENRTAKDVDIEGNTYRLSTPFVAITAAMFSEGVLSNVEIENGKLTSVGSQDVIIGTALPGLSNSLKAKENDITKDIDNSKPNEYDFFGRCRSCFRNHSLWTGRFSDSR